MAKKERKKSENQKKENDFFDRFPWTPYILIIVLVGALYYQTVDFNIVECDDHEIILKDYERISQISDWDKEFFRSYMDASYYRPLINISFMINAQISGKELWSYHAFNFLFHAFAACLIFILLRLFGFGRSVAFIGGALWAVHPIFVNSVAWIVGRNDILFSFFSLAAFVSLIKYSRKIKIHYLVLHILFFLLALFSKETAAIIPALFVAYLVLLDKSETFSKRNVSLFVIWIVCDLLWLYIRSLADLGEPVYTIGLSELVYNLRTVPEFFAKIFLPIDLSTLPTYGAFNTIAGLIIIAILVASLILTKKHKNPLTVFSIVWIFALLLPGMFILLKNYNVWNEYLECRFYLPTFGAFLLIFSIIPWDKLKNRGKEVFSVTSVVIVVLFILAFNESENYENPIAYYESAIADDPSKANFHFVLGQIYYNAKYKGLKGQKYKRKATEEVEKAIELRTDKPLYYKTLGAIYSSRKMYDSAIKYIKISLKLDSTLVDSYNGLAFNYYDQKQYKKAIGIWKKAVSIKPDHSDVLYNITCAYLIIGKADSAKIYANKTIEADKSEKNVKSISFLLNEWGGKYIQQGRSEIGADLLKQSIQLYPKSYAPYENLMNYYYMIKPNPDSASYYARKLAKFNRKINPKIIQFIKSNRKQNGQRELK